jgi:spore germination protein YaaH
LFNAPLSWIKKTLEFYVDHSKPNKSDLLKKILLGLPFHGFQTDTSGKESKLSILDSSAYSNIVLSGRVENFRWDKEECEHLIEMDGNKSLAMFPTKKFIKERLEFCKTNNLAGVAVWDIGLGLESFLDEF